MKTKESIILHHKVNLKHKKGHCRITEGDKKCKIKTHCRGLCSRHHTFFLRWDLIDQFGAPKKFVYVEQTEYKINKSAPKDQCRILENDKACERHIHGRGVCARHWLALDRHDLLIKYGTSSRKDPKIIEVKKRITEGVCRVIEDGKRCMTSSTTRELCSKHYLRFMRHGSLKKYGAKIKT